MLTIKQKPHQRLARHGKKAGPALKALRNIAITALVLGGLLVGGAAAYSWYSSQHSEAPKPAGSATIKKAPVAKGPVKPSPTGRVNASVQMINTPVAPGENVSLSIRTNADANCKIVVEYDARAATKVKAVDSGLVDKTADDYGLVGWSWTVDPSAPLGKAQASVTCANEKNSALVIADFEVKR